MSASYLGIQTLERSLQRLACVVSVDDHMETLADMRSAFDLALAILNDLLNFDKLESGTFMIEPTDVYALKYLSRGLTNQLSLLASGDKSAKLTFDILMTDGGTDRDDDDSGGMQYLDKRDVLYIDKYGTTCTHRALPLYTHSTHTLHTLTFHPFPVPPSHIDRYKIDQVFRNLCSNALKFTPAGKKVTVRIRKVAAMLPAVEASSRRGTSAEPKAKARSVATDIESGRAGCDKDGAFRGACASDSDVDHDRDAIGTLVVEVIDEGTGIASENITRLFKEVVQFNPGELQAGGGSGLGMMISKGIVDIHGGTLSVWSAGVGHGSTFTLRLPLYSKSPPNSPDYSAASSPLQSCLQSAAQSALQSRRGSDAGDDDVQLLASLGQDRDQAQDDHGVMRAKFGHMTLPLPLPPPLAMTTHGAPVDSLHTQTDALAAASAHQAPSGARVLNLLVVDDSKLNRRMLRRLLTAEVSSSATVP